MSDPMHVPPPCEFELDKLVIKLHEVVSSDIKVIDEVVEKIVSLIEDRRCWEDLEDVDLALREALVNAIIHGNKCHPRNVINPCGVSPTWETGVRARKLRLEEL